MFKFSLFSFLVAFFDSVDALEIRGATSIEPTFYTTGDYRARGYSGGTDIFWNENYGIKLMYSGFHYNDDKVVFFNDVESDVWNIGLIAKSSNFNNQAFGLTLGFSVHHKKSDETILIRSAKDSASTLRFIGHYFETAREIPGTDANRFRLRAKIVDTNGQYEIGISEVRDYILNGVLLSVFYEVNPFQNMWLQLMPKVNWYPSEPLFIWSLGIGVCFPLYVTEK